jgi:hypothetical protein
MRTALITALLLLLSARSARADHFHSYGGEVAVADVGALGLVVVGGSMRGVNKPIGNGVALLGAGLYLLGGPVLHVKHRRLAEAFTSGLARLVIPAYAASRPYHGDGDGAFIVTALRVGAGAGIAMLVDWIALSWERVPDKVTPAIDVGPDGAIVSLAGRF